MTDSRGGNPPAAGPGTPAPVQPRWAWWVVGIVVPVVGIAAALFVSNRHSAPYGGESAAAAGAPSAAHDKSQPSAGGGSGSKKPKSRVLYGPVPIQFETSAYGVDIDFDSRKPLVGDSLKGGDLSAVTDASGMAGTTNFHGGPRLAALIAPISNGSSDPSEADCAEALQSNGDESFNDPPSDAQFCVQTTEGRVAFVRVAPGAPAGQSMKLTATVWDLV
ncbi:MULTISPECIES: hypothetical protein [unclassified Streptomyces]|uniref:hypothetical protein n=1 Tax=unclassified Streptomyces TaxID=2593676 RepID=UPI002E80DD39|nr:hypothetical protein [Streptomyces sp. NBC_00589]WTI37471.1 hypothetical protein OIC96_21855 [Streptomyces sp. NBC_00775]WUB28851.1 hypothetical protein OHA51_27880 [Streptomyces sp. NBC_00589]